MDLMEAKLKHLELIQRVVDRYVSGSFRLKGWAVALVSAIIALAAREDRFDIALLGLIPVVYFWCLDGNFLWKERGFRNLYDSVRMLEPKDIDFSMHTERFRADEPRILKGLRVAPSRDAVCLLLLTVSHHRRGGGISLRMATRPCSQLMQQAEPELVEPAVGQLQRGHRSTVIEPERGPVEIGPRKGARRSRAGYR